MYDQLYKQALFGTLVNEVLCAIALGLALWWLWRNISRVRSGAGSRLQVALAGALVAATAVIAVGLAVFALIGLPWFIESMELRDAGEQEQAALIGQPAPHLHFAGVADDRTYQLDEFHGDVVLINFWATWCRPCRKEMPDLERVQLDLGARGLTVIHLSKEPRDTLTRYLEKQQPANLHVYAYATQWPAFALPTTYVVDREGVVRDVRVGGSSYDEFAGMVEPYF